MRTATLLVVVLSLAVVGAAEDRFSLGLADMPVELGSDKSLDEQGLEPADGDIRVELSESVDREALVYHSAIVPRSPAEYRLMLWSSPMGRLHYDAAAMESMIGRTGLVGGGRMVGVGLSTTALGDGDPGGLGKLLQGESWNEFSLNEKVDMGIQASFIAALLYYMSQNAD